MEEKKINYGLIVFIVIVIVLFIPIISDYIKKQNIEVLSANEISDKIITSESFLVYVGDLDKDTKKDLRIMRDITKKDFSYEYNVYNVKKSNDIEKIVGKDVVAALIVEGDVQKTYKKYDFNNLNNDVKTYFIGDINEDNASYKVAKNFKEFKKLVKSDEVTVSVFGRESCFYCNKFKPVYNAVAEKYDVDIYYFDSDNYDSSQYKKIINMDLTVPAKCSSQGSEFKLAEGFGTPLTIFTKDNKVIDCISGYVNRSSLIETLISNKLISE